MMRSGLFAVVLSSVVLTGCVAPPREQVAVKTPFDLAEHAPFRESGKGSVQGQGFLRQAGGGTVTCAGSTVVLLPATPFFKEFVDLYIAGKTPTVTPPPGDRAPLFRRSQCDAQGNFSFESVPPANWTIMTEVKWVVGHSPQGGILRREVAVREDAPTRVLLTDADLARR